MEEIITSNYAIIIRENTEDEPVVCEVSMVKPVEWSETTETEAFQYVCKAIGIEYGDFDYRYELYTAK